MALWPSRMYEREMMKPWRDIDRFERRMMRDMDRFQRQMMPYWRDEMDRHSILDIANQAHEIVNDDKKFAVQLDVSKFKPEELQVHIDGRNLTIEGKQEQKTDHGHMERSFVRSWTLPDEVDLDAVHTQLTEVGQLCIEAPKTGLHTNRRLPHM
ncbi:Hsp20/alpha crystallin family protein [Oesophagostomum dentatum]|uniref:Hsp20/alpha crystallin family protein n=1 Tax=Oesophagostomum dentatum TaxID=61180 RepID=A0A0B1RTF5_OESDE|nr:Hsp20/alpha crystallin family protein [Oesophagostomum dentatum]